jgi:hypothetical protein
VIFQRLLLLCLAAPGAPVGCKAEAEARAPEDDASQPLDDAADEASPDDSPSLFPDSVVDASVSWCEAGPPELTEAAPCNDYYFVPCGLPSGVVLISAIGDLSRCNEICPNPTGQIQGCEIVQSADAAPEAAATLPESGTPVTVVCTLCQPGRKPAGLRKVSQWRGGNVVGAYFAQAAHFEAASVFAFHRLRDELRALGAPRSLVCAAERAAKDEMLHAQMVGGLARRGKGVPLGPRVARRRRRSLAAIAIENAVEGCVRETYGALVAHWQARRSKDVAVRTAMARIAVDETRHAALAWAVARFLDRRLDDRARRRVADARRGAAKDLSLEAGVELHRDLIGQAGLPPARAALQLVSGMTSALWT